MEFFINWAHGATYWSILIIPEFDKPYNVLQKTLFGKVCASFAGLPITGVAKGGPGAPFLQISNVSCRFVLCGAVPQIKCCCSLKVKIFGPSQNFWLAALLFLVFRLDYFHMQLCLRIQRIVFTSFNKSETLSSIPARGRWTCFSQTSINQLA